MIPESQATPRARPRLPLVVAIALGALLIPASASRADPAVATFTYSPSAPLTGETVTFTSTSSGTVTSTSWDLDGDGSCDDAEGATAQRAFSVAGDYAVRLCVNVDESVQKQTVTVRNREPAAGFAYSPRRPVPGQVVTLTSTSADPDGPIMEHAWSLDADGLFDDGDGSAVTRSWSEPGVYAVSLRVVDRDGAVSIASGSIRVVRPRPALLSPFPVVRLVGSVTRSGALVRALLVQAPRGARIVLRCRGAACPYRRVGTRARGRVRFRRLQRRLPAGTLIEVSVTEPGKIGKYTRFRIRRSRTPARVDRCLTPGARRPVSCPSG